MQVTDLLGNIISKETTYAGESLKDNKIKVTTIMMSLSEFKSGF